MNAVDSIKYTIKLTDMIVGMYLGDLTQDEMLVRPCEGGNHITWQLGHLLKSTVGISGDAMPAPLPALPDGFADKYTKETAASDNLADFHTKDELMSLYATQRDALLAALETLSDADLERSVPDHWKQIGTTTGELNAFQPFHWMMHTGQWAIVRRKLGKPPLF
ncbi:MAG TPA: DinB family protein [Planctomycetaceae bacterium]|nr:DinB family protein [Planctomycetaceae bacterium]